MNHLLRALAPISDAGWQLLDGEAKAARDARRWPPAGSSTSQGRMAGSTRRRTSDARSRSRSSPADGVSRAAAARAPRGRAARRLRAVAVGAARRRPRRRRHRPRAPRRRRAPDRGRGEHRGLPRLAERDQRHRRGLAARAAAARATPSRIRGQVAGAVEQLLAERGRRPLRTGAGQRGVPRRARDGRARRLPAERAPEQDRRTARSSMRRASTGAVS